MSRIIQVITSPLTLISKKLGDTVRMVALTAIGNAILPGFGAAIGSLVAGGIAGMGGKPPSPSSQTDRLHATIDPRAPLKRAFGKTALATDIRYEEWFGTNQEKCGQIIAVASHKIESILEIWLNDELAWSAAAGVVSKFVGYFSAPHIVLEGGASNGVTFGSGQWNDTRRLTGCAFVYLEFKVTGNTSKAQSPFSGGVPSRMTIIGKGGMVYDPRLDSTVPGGSGSMRADDQTTWAFAVSGTDIGGNIPLQILAELLGWKIGGKLALGSGLPKKRIDLASFITAANLADESVGIAAGGTEPRYRGAGVLSEGDDPQTRLNTMLAACNGRLRDGGGRLSLVLMHNDLASAAADDGLTTDDVMGAFIWNPDPALDKTPNTARGKFTDPSSNSLYQQIDYPEVGLTSPDGIERVLPYDVVWCESASQAQRVVKQNLQRKQYDRTFQAPFDMRAWKYNVGDVVPLTFSPLNFTRALFRVQAIDPRTNPATVVLTAESADIYAWDHDDRAPVVPAAPIVYNTLNDPLIQAIADAGSSSLQQAIANSFPVGLTISAADTGAVTISNHTRRYTDGHADVAVTGATISTGLSPDDLGAFAYDDPNRVGGAVTYQLFSDDLDAHNSPAHPGYHYVGGFQIPATGAPPSDGVGASPPGGTPIKKIYGIFDVDGGSA